MADVISELWRVGWRPSTPSITQWWTWEASPWQLGGWGGVEATNGVKDRAGEGSKLPQYVDWTNKGWGRVCGWVGGDGEKCVRDWGQGYMIGVLDRPQLALLNVCVWDEDGFADCLCISYVWHINKSALRHLSRIFVLQLFNSTGHKTTLLNLVQFSSWHLWQRDPRPLQMMNVVIRSSVTPFSKSCWGVMSLWGPLVSYSHWYEDHLHQSSKWLKWGWLLSGGASLCWFLLGSSVESPRSRHTQRERAHERERGVR